MFQTTDSNIAGGDRSRNDSNSSQARRPARSKNGCLTCRRRKVRCDEQRPRCSHCERLNLHCQWRPLVHSTAPLKSPSAAKNGAGRATHGELATGRQQLDTQSPDNLGSVASPSSQLLPPQSGQGAVAGVDQFFDYASFMWSDGGLWGQLGGAVSVGEDWVSPNPRECNPTATPTAANPGERADPHPGDATMQQNRPIDSQLSQHPASSTTASVGLSVFQGEDGDLLAYFINTVVPPILAEVETQKKWAAMRRMLLSMAAASTMVRYSILAFSSLLRCRRETPWLQVGQHYYENATKELAASTDGDNLASLKEHSARRQNLLATLFFLCYIDILDDRVGMAHTNLKRAYTIFRQGDRRGFHPVEMHLLSWIRLLDARAVSAGGEGLFLSDKDENLLVQSSPGSLGGTGNDAGDALADGMSTGPSDLLAGPGLDRDIEDVLFELLYQPGIVFYQKVQSFMGRISKIDPWHRSRGTVEDETEVMSIAAGILRDLRALLSEGSPALMRHAVAGKLRAPHVSPNLAFTITRAFRTYLSNYYASKIHLHRVAWRHLPLTAESMDALAQIRHLARLMVEDAASQQPLEELNVDPAGPPTLGSDERPQTASSSAATATVPANAADPGSGPQVHQIEPPQQQQQMLPVNMLWPLLMWGTEEKDPAERDWIRDQILRMEKVASNARATAQVLEEVQRRQDATNARQDIRAVMHTVFDSCWAIV